jgi:hypothetical protein
MRKGRTALVLLISAAALIGCGGGSGGDGEIIDDSMTIAANFVAEEPTPPASTVTLQKSAASSNLVTVRVDATGVSSVYGAAFELAFDPTLAEYVGYTKGTFFEQGGHIPTYTVSSPTGGQIVVGVTRNGNVAGVSTTASRAIVNVTFRVKKAGTGSVSLPDAVLYDAQVQPQPIPGVQWHTGTLQGS